VQKAPVQVWVEMSQKKAPGQSTLELQPASDWHDDSELQK
jgi:hypothetical protein